MTFTGVVAQSFQRQWTLCDKAVASAWRARRTLVTARMLLVAEGPDRIGALLVHGRAIHARLCSSSAAHSDPITAALKALERPLCCSVQDTCVPAILSVRIHMHRSSKIMLFCVDWGGGGAAGIRAFVAPPL